MGHIHHDANPDKISANIIETIASETHRSVDEVKRVYDDEYARLKSDAHISNYLVLLATRRTRAVLAKPH